MPSCSSVQTSCAKNMFQDRLRPITGRSQRSSVSISSSTLSSFITSLITICSFQATAGELFRSKRNASGRIVRRRQRLSTANDTPTIVSVPFTTSTRSKLLQRLPPSARKRSPLPFMTSADVRKSLNSFLKARRAMNLPLPSADLTMIASEIFPT